MHTPDCGKDVLPPSLTLMKMVGLQDHLLSASNDLGRLETLLDDACRTLMVRFHEAAAQVHRLPSEDAGLRDQVARQIGGAITALQFQDMASQLISHTCRRLRHCADLLANEAFRDDDDGAGLVMEAPLRPNPVTQAEMDAGSVELF